MQITKEEFLAWLKNPVTEEFKKIKQERADRIAHGLARGQCQNNFQGIDPFSYGYSCGQYEEIRDTLEMTYEDMLPGGSELARPKEPAVPGTGEWV